MTCRTIIGWLGLAVAGAAASAADDPAAAFEQARTAFDAGRFAEAAEMYGRWTQPGRASAEAWYNLGNARYRMGDPGGAALAYRRARRMRPRDPDIEANLRHVQRAAGAAVDTERLAWRWIRSVTPGEWAAIGLAGYGAGFGILCLLAFIPSWRWAGRRAVLLCGALALVGAAGRVAWWWSDRTPAVVIVDPEGVAMRFAPLPDAPVQVRLPPASMVRQTGGSGGWRRVRLDRALGWIPETAAEPVPPVREVGAGTVLWSDSP